MPATSSLALRCASVVLAAILLTGCTSEAAPSPTAPPTPLPASKTPSATPTASATADKPTIEKITTPPAVPVDLKTPGKVGSKAAVEYFVALYGYTLNTGDTSLLRSISAPTCEYCSALAEGAEKLADEDRLLLGSALSIDLAKLYEPESSNEHHTWLMDLVIAPGIEVSPEGERVDRPRETHTTALVAAWSDGAWKIEAKRGVNELPAR
ncbi:hypothetical protein ATL41_1164 [Flavimobilis soli]|uniref:DUF6318 domain-containing protein n=1 Tax=Flavimobilis soli TaxID=442709 RepID=A0A2A9ED29_9MICO|nr:DUF6318 family protein [Flavimobilis soli]PFG36441.1 hypothetical protein ATL41_1164 [Flavimobilis soli]